MEVIESDIVILSETENHRTKSREKKYYPMNSPIPVSYIGKKVKYGQMMITASNS